MLLSNGMKISFSSLSKLDQSGMSSKARRDSIADAAVELARAMERGEVARFGDERDARRDSWLKWQSAIAKGRA
jgi:hypothetical protein